MNRNPKLAYWRVGLVFLVYGVLYLGSQGTLDYQWGAVLMPLYVLFRPEDPDVIADWPRVRQAGLLFYLLKWTLVIFAIALVLIVPMALLTHQDIWLMAKSLRERPVFLLSPAACVLISWFSNQRLREKYDARMAAQQKGQKKSPKRKKKRNA